MELDIFSEGQIRWAIETGLGPLFFQAAKAHPQSPRHPLWPLLQSADLTARVVSAEQIRATEEIIDACAAKGHILTLLKGISICQEHYPQFHLRLMRDLDFLVPRADLPSIESTLLHLGYRQRSGSPPDFFEGHHHTMPFFHPQRGVWVEVHHQLIPPRRALGKESVLSLENTRGHLRPSLFQGRKVNRLCAELQLVYCACHWASYLNVVGGMIAMLDLIYLLDHTRGKLRWDKILDWLTGPIASAHLYLLLSYLDKYQIVEIAPDILRELSIRQRSFGSGELRIVNWLINRYIVEGKALGRLLNLRNMRILWDTLLLPAPPTKKLLLLPWNLLPKR